jgi:hypothetical protein
MMGVWDEEISKNEEYMDYRELGWKDIEVGNLQGLRLHAHGRCWNTGK